MLRILLVGMLTGAFAGVAVTFYNMLAEMAEEFARGYYGFFRENPAFLPLLFVGLALGAIVIGGLLRFLPVIRGSGIPQTEGALRGLMRFSWYRALTGMFAASLFAIFCGLSAGAEGPSVLIGGCCGYGANDLLRQGAFLRRYQITGGACAGLAAAFNAPLTGIVFAFEEGQKKFTPEVFVCAFTSVAFAVVIRNLLRTALGFAAGAYLDTFAFPESAFSDPLFYAYVLFAAAVCALCGVGLYYLIFAARKLFAKLTFWRGMGRMLFPFLAAGAFGILTAYALGGGHGFLEDLGSRSEGVRAVFSSPLWATLLIVALGKGLLLVLNMGAGVPCGAFVPMLATGAGAGALLSLLCARMGMDAAYADALIVICMSAFFTAVVKAPLTGLILTAELTWNFMFLLPAVIGVGLGYLAGLLFRTRPVYDRLLDEMLQEEGACGAARGKADAFSACFCVEAGSLAAGRAVRDVLWPSNVRLVRVRSQGVLFVPDGNTVLQAGDLVFAEGEQRFGSAEEELCAVLGSRVLPRAADAAARDGADGDAAECGSAGCGGAPRKR